jgi:hypothetical protein
MAWDLFCLKACLSNLFSESWHWTVCRARRYGTFSDRVRVPWSNWLSEQEINKRSELWKMRSSQHMLGPRGEVSRGRRRGLAMAKQNVYQNRHAAAARKVSREVRAKNRSCAGLCAPTALVPETSKSAAIGADADARRAVGGDGPCGGVHCQRAARDKHKLREGSGLAGLEQRRRAPRGADGDAAKALLAEAWSQATPADNKSAACSSSWRRHGGEIWNMVGYRPHPGPSSKAHEQLMGAHDIVQCRLSPRCEELV